eukprot:gene2513-2902_t
MEEIPHQEIIQRPSYICENWEEVIHSNQLFRSLADIDKIYDIGKPTAKKLVYLFKMQRRNEKELEALGFLKKLVRSLTSKDAGKFLRFATGADTICVEKIKVTFNNLSGMQRRVVAHTCGPVLELPTTYQSYVEFKKEMLSILRSGYWNMDFV